MALEMKVFERLNLVKGGELWAADDAGLAAERMNILASAFVEVCG